MIIMMIRIQICKLLVKRKKYYTIKNMRQRQNENPLNDYEVAVETRKTEKKG